MRLIRLHARDNLFICVTDSARVAYVVFAKQWAPYIIYFSETKDRLFRKWNREFTMFSKYWDSDTCAGRYIQRSVIFELNAFALIVFLFYGDDGNWLVRALSDKTVNDHTQLCILRHFVFTFFNIRY